MKKLWNILMLTLALNFIAVAGFTGWLYQTGRLDREKANVIREIVFPTTKPADATTRPADDHLAGDPSTQPTLRLEELLAKQSGRSAGEQVDFIKHAFDTQMAQLDRRAREIADRQAAVDTARQRLAADRAQLDADRRSLEEEKQLATRLQGDKGFQDSLQLYLSMPAKQVKDIFLTLDDETVVRYLQAMEPRAAAKITKEYKKPEELDRLQKLMERMRQSQPSPTTREAA